LAFFATVSIKRFTGIQSKPIAREKQRKHYKRDWKNELVDLMNPNWEDLTGNCHLPTASGS
jgi:predicted GIY-YIG superfamily endonuclease